MRNTLLFCSLIILITACQTTNTKNLMTVSGSIKGIKKGKIYLQKLKTDTTVVNVDSFKFKGNSNFKLSTSVPEPELFFLYLNRPDGDSLIDKLVFFGEKGSITINTFLNTFTSSAKIEGSKNQVVYQNYKSTMRKFDAQDLKLLKLYYHQNADSQITEEEYRRKSDANLKRKYLYSINFAKNNADTEFAPYLGKYYIPDANPIFLDTIYKSLTPKIKNSKYGKELKTYLDSISTN